MRLVMPSARPKFDTRTVAPCSCAMRATAKPIELSIVTPATRIRLPSRMPMLVVLLVSWPVLVGWCRWWSGRRQWPMPRPPSTGMTAPVTYAAASEPSHCTTDATSSTEA